MFYQRPNTCGFCGSTTASVLLVCTCTEDCGTCCPAADDLKYERPTP